LVYALINLRNILIPICFSLMLAILLNRMVMKLESFRFPKFWAIAVTLFVAFILLVGLGYFLSSQMISFGDDLPILKKKFSELFIRFQRVLTSELGLSLKQQERWL